MDDEELRALYEGSCARLVGQIYAVNGDLHAAQDAVHEAFVRALTRRSTLARTDNPEAWLRTVALNAARSRWRRLRRLDVLLDRRPAPVDAPGLSPDRVALVAAMRQLSVEQREAVAMHHVLDMSVAEIAVATGSAVGTVKARISRGRARLAVLLDDRELAFEAVEADRG